MSFVRGHSWKFVLLVTPRSVIEQTHAYNIAQKNKKLLSVILIKSIDTLL